MMNRTTGGYIVMILVCGVTLWGILHVGSKLKAPTDWSGQWQWIAEGQPSVPVTIEQSGEFFHIRVGTGPSRSYTLETREDYSLLNGTDQVLVANYMFAKEGKTLHLDDQFTHRKMMLIQDAPR